MDIQARHKVVGIDVSKDTLAVCHRVEEKAQHLETENSKAGFKQQPYPAEHTAVHWEMLRFGLRTKDAKEVVGQLPRLPVGGVKSWAGINPVGMGRSPDNLQQILKSAAQLKTRW